MSVNNNNFDQNVQDALVSIQNKYNEVKSWIDQMNADNDAINRDAQRLKTEIYNHNDCWWIFHNTKVNKTLQKELNADIASKKDDMNQLADKIQAANTDGSFDSLIAAIKSCIDGETTVANSQKNGETKKDNKRLAYDLMEISRYITALLDALEDKVAEVELQEEIQIVSSQNQDDPNISRQVSSMVEELISEIGKEGDILGSLRSSSIDDFVNYNTAYNNADVNQNGIRWWDDLDPSQNAEARKYKDKQIKKNATDMMALIGEINNAITPELASLMPDFTAIQASIDQIIRKLTEILNPNLSEAERSKLLVSIGQEIMNLFVLVMGLLGIVQQDAAKDKAKNEATMSESTTAAAQMSISNSQAQAKKIEQDLKYASIMNDLMTAAKYTLMAVAAVAVPGIGSMLVGMILIALEASGVLEKATKALASKMGQLGAEIFMGGLEMIATMGAGAALDAALRATMKEVMKAVAQTVAKTVEEAVAKATANVAEELGEQAAKSMEPVIEQTVKTAMETAEKKAFTMFFSQNGLRLGIQWMKEAAMGGYGASNRMVEQVMTKAAEEAIEKSAQEAADMIILIAKSSADELTVAERVAITRIAIKAGSQAAATVMNATMERADKVSVIGENKLKDAAWRGGFTELYAIGANNVLVDFAQFMQDKFHYMSDDDFDKLKIALEVIQALLMAISQMVGSGAAAQYMNDGNAAMQAFFKISNVAQLAATSGEAAASYSTYEIDKAEAGATTRMREIDMVLDVLLQMLAPWIENRRKEESKYDNQKFVEMQKNTVSVSENANKNLDFAAQAMLA